MRITGNIINYYFVCQRKLWLFSHGLRYETSHENVQLGKLLDQSSYQKKKKQIQIDGTILISADTQTEKLISIEGSIAVDFLEEWKIIHEVKKSRAIEPAAVWQLKYYLYFLEQQGIEVEKGFLDYPKLRERQEIKLTAADRKAVEQLLLKVLDVTLQDTSPAVEKLTYCSKCAYYEYCFS
ncbi:CRISPR-associated protein Cas4 [Enterococcus sp. CSURQ0835]|uniref:CRISPR-associated protein Cas4 n=1 Tax=Enterococcus sp. CSURQ0835 TaxID=2681394 RepID=UPI001358BBE2|nr:CRISPR-associated protein Cas4 [Enterococcus sp. CSURQ0835]